MAMASEALPGEGEEWQNGELEQKDGRENEDDDYEGDRGIDPQARSADPTRWKPQGSEEEIEDEAPRSSREKIRYTMERRRREMNAPVDFSDKDAQEMWNSSQMECRPFKDPNFQRKMQVDRGDQEGRLKLSKNIQVGSEMSVPASLQAEPQDADAEQAEGELKSARVVQFLRNVRGAYETGLQQNEVFDLLEDELAGLGDDEAVPESKTEGSISEYQSLTDVEFCRGKSVSSVDWLPNARGVVAMALISRASLEERLATSGQLNNAYILVWNFVDPIHYQLQRTLRSPFEVTSFRFNPSLPNVVAGGLQNGQVALWETQNVDDSSPQGGSKRNAGQEQGDDRNASPILDPIHLSVIESSHTAPVSDVAWIPKACEVDKLSRLTNQQNQHGEISFEATEELNQFATIALDGKLLIWDMRVKRDMRAQEYIWTPLIALTLYRSDRSVELSGTRFDLNPHEPTLYAVGMNGEVCFARFGRQDEDHELGEPVLLEKAHAGPVVAVERHPHPDMSDIILTVAWWGFKIWKEGLETPIFESPRPWDRLTGGCWSPTRVAVLFLTLRDGRVEVWDFLDRSHEPSMTQAVSSASIGCCTFARAKPSRGRQMLAVGDDYGILHVLQVPRNLMRRLPNEEANARQLFEREHARVHYYSQRNRAARTEDHEEPEEQASQPEHPSKRQSLTGRRDSTASGQPSPGDEDDPVEIEYQRIELEVRSKLGV